MRGRGKTIVIRRAAAADVETLFEIRTSVVENHQTRQELAALGVTPEAVAVLLRGDRTAAFLATDGDQTLGFSMARADLGDIFALFVRPEAQSAGLGSQLLAEAERWLIQKNVSSAWLLTGDESGSRAVAFTRNADGVRKVARLTTKSASRRVCTTPDDDASER